ncbi:MAG: hypothetical protein K0V04_10090 [Deltaproteobacteria bacterium]|nr:hypothetical protein [Deltaproteobacteria bacterium]
MRTLLVFLVLPLAACDPASEGQPLELRPAVAEEPTPLLDPAEHLAAQRNDPSRVDICEGYGRDPGVRLTNDTLFPGEVVVPDLCISTVPNVLGCWMTDHVTDIGATGQLELWCDFACSGVHETVEIVAGFPQAGQEVRLVFGNPCG